MTTEAKKLTYADYLALPETKQPYEIVDGTPLMAPAPTPYHQVVVLNIAVLLKSYIQPMDLGIVLAAPVDMLVQREPLRTRQPDVLFLSAERTGFSDNFQLRGLQFLEVAPDLVVEVLSPSNTRRDIAEKLGDYRQIGVLECWLVSPEAETIEVLALSSDVATFGGIFGVDDEVQSQVLSGLALRPRQIFG
jgi:Uma2 family endonuclease